MRLLLSLLKLCLLPLLAGVVIVAVTAVVLIAMFFIGCGTSAARDAKVREQKWQYDSANSKGITTALRNMSRNQAGPIDRKPPIRRAPVREF